MYLVEGVGRRLRVVVVIVGSGHEVGDGYHAGPIDEGGDQHVTIVLVLLMGGEGVDGIDAEAPADIGVEDGGKHTWRVETRKAAPVDRAVVPDKRRRRHVAYQSVVVHVSEGTRGC